MEDGVGSIKITKATFFLSKCVILCILSEVISTLLDLPLNVVLSEISNGLGVKFVKTRTGAVSQVLTGCTVAPQSCRRWGGGKENDIGMNKPPTLNTSQVITVKNAWAS